MQILKELGSGLQFATKLLVARSKEEISPSLPQSKNQVQFRSNHFQEIAEMHRKCVKEIWEVSRKRTDRLPFQTETDGILMSALGRGKTEFRVKLAAWGKTLS
jgi:hypothetical protein